MSDLRVFPLFMSALLLMVLFSGCISDDGLGGNHAPFVSIENPGSQRTVSNLVMISGHAWDPDGNESVERVEISIDDAEWISIEGADHWSYEWNTLDLDDERMYNISVRCFDGELYSSVVSVYVYLDNPDVVEGTTSRWAVLIATANFPENLDQRLGNGGLVLAERMAAYLIEECGYPTSNIFILFDDGWVRAKNGLGAPVETLQMRYHEYDVTYGPATIDTVESVIEYVVDSANMNPDSEVFFWLFNHGYGNLEDPLFGGKVLESSMIYLWDDLLSDEELGEMLSTLKSDKVTMIVDACFSGGFADKTIYHFPTSILMRSGLPRAGRVVISGSSKYRAGFASTTQGPLFTQLWFEGLSTGAADGYRPGLFYRGMPPSFESQKDGVVSVEEAFYYARYILRTEEALEDYSSMEPQISDRYPGYGVFSLKDLVLG